MRRIIIAFCGTLLLTNASPFVDAHSSAANIPISGCYSDIELLANEGMVVGNGSFVIRKANGRYVATFTELMHDGGESYPEVAIENLIVDETKRIITFDVALHSGRNVTVLRRVTGKVMRAGIKMNWRGHSAEHGQANPFMRREKCRLSVEGAGRRQTSHLSRPRISIALLRKTRMLVWLRVRRLNSSASVRRFLEI